MGNRARLDIAHAISPVRFGGPDRDSRVFAFSASLAA